MFRVSVRIGLNSRYRMCWFGVYPLLLCIFFKIRTTNAEHVCQFTANMTKIFYSKRYLTASTNETQDHGLRIGLHFSEDFKALPDYKYIKENVVEPAVQFWSDALSARNALKESLLLNRACVNNLYANIKESDERYHSYCAYGCAAESYCGHMAIPSDYLDICREFENNEPIQTGTAGAGCPKTDVLLLVDAKLSTICLSSTLAYAATCQIEPELDRPILGFINLCPNVVNFSYPGKRQLYDILRHEIAHALGFNSALYAYMRDENGEPRTLRNSQSIPINGVDENNVAIPSSSTVDNVRRDWKSAVGVFTREVKVLKTPAVLKVAREHFNCPNLDGVELEDQGSSGTAASHFEKRLVHNELMAGSLSTPCYTSKLTLAYFKDTGWYHVNLSKFESWRWGSKLGCDFVLQSCYMYMQIRKSKNASINPWCESLGNDGNTCLDYENAVGKCNVRKFSEPLPRQYQYFLEIPGVNSSKVNRYGGQDYLMDYCPVLKPWYNEISKSSTFCAHGENNQLIDLQSNLKLQIFGSNSTCLITDPQSTWDAHTCRGVTVLSGKQAGCYKYTCSITGGLLIQVGMNSFQCPLAGGLVHVESTNAYANVRGDLLCPPCAQMCSNCPTKQLVIALNAIPSLPLRCGAYMIGCGSKLQIVTVMIMKILLPIP